MRYGIVKLTEGNLANNHIYLGSVMALFPPEVVGGSSKAMSAPHSIEVHHGSGAPTVTDIDGIKNIFRTRSWEAEFFSAHALKAGDAVVIEHTGARRYHVYPHRTP